MKQTRPKKKKKEGGNTDCMTPFMSTSKKCKLMYSDRKQIRG